MFSIDMPHNYKHAFHQSLQSIFQRKRNKESYVHSVKWKGQEIVM